MPIFPIERSITVKGLSVRRKQIPICPAFCLTDYKVQGSTLSAAILDLKNDTARRGQDSHRKYCSFYVQLSRLRSFQDLHLLQKITLDDLRFSPDPDLIVEMERLRALEAKTLATCDLGFTCLTQPLQLSSLMLILPRPQDQRPLMPRRFRAYSVQPRASSSSQH